MEGMRSQECPVKFQMGLPSELLSFSEAAKLANLSAELARVSLPIPLPLLLVPRRSLARIFFSDGRQD